MLFSSVLFAVALAHSRFIVKLKAHEGLVKRDSEELDLGWVKEIITKHDGNSFAESEPSAITYEYNFNNFMGFAVQTSDEAIAEIEANPNVEYWTHDNPITLFAPTPQDQQVSAVKSWGLDRIDQRALPLNSEFKSMPFKGEGVTVFVIDTGIDSRHPDFEGRARVGPSFVHGVYTELKTDNSDTNGHGTHCSGTIASKSFGVAPKATIIGLKIFDNTGGGDAGVIAAVQYAVKNAVPGKTVISMSIGTDLQNCVPNPKPNQEGCNNQAMKDAVKAAVAANIPVAAAAGNDNTDACRVAPASEPSVYTVASSTSSDSKSGFSNHGPCVDIIAPGSSITSTWLNLRTNTISGTSMAAPHVAGVFAVLLSEKSYKDAQSVYNVVTEMSTKGAIKGLPANTVNNLLYVQ